MDPLISLAQLPALRRALGLPGSVKAAILGAVQAGISLAVAFGWQVSDTQTASIMLFVGMATAVFIRQTSKPKSAYNLAA